ncbi:MAG: AMMECR1 domain-containing protein, partial [Nanoarchaeota archaeon]
MVSQQEKKQLLAAARKAIESRGHNSVQHTGIPPSLKEAHGVFVTLTINDELRGCIGYLLPEQGVFDAVIT